MSLIITSGMDGKYCAVHCNRCNVFCFWEELAVVSDMALRGVVPYCWDCDPLSGDMLPQHTYYLDDFFLLGIGDRSFLGEWKTDDLEIRQEDLKLTKITSAAWYALKTGNIKMARAPLSSWTNLHGQRLEKGGVK